MLLWVILLLGGLYASCGDETECVHETGVFKNMTGCGVVIEMEDGALLQIATLIQLDVEVDGETEYCIEFEEYEEGTANCEGVELINIISVVNL